MEISRGAQAAERDASAAQIGEVGGGFAVTFDRARRSEQLAEFDLGLGRVTAFLERALENIVWPS